MAYADDVTQIYMQQLGRAPDAGGMAHFTNLLQNGGSVQDVVRQMQASPESVANNAFANMKNTMSAYNAGTIGANQRLDGSIDPNAPTAMPTPTPMPRPGGQPTSGYPGQGGMSAGGGSNPYLSQISDYIGNQSQFQLGQAFNNIRSNAVGAGGLGGSRMGVAEGIATGLANQGLTGQLASLWGNSWDASQNRGLQARGQDMGFFTAQRGQDQQGAMLGAQLNGMAIDQQWAPALNAGSLYKSFSGLGGTEMKTGSEGGGWMGGVGGALGGAKFGRDMKWW